MKIYKDENGAWRIGAVTNPGQCGFTVIGNKVKIFAQSNDKSYGYEKITDIQFQNAEGEFENCTSEADFREKVATIDFFLNAPASGGGEMPGAVKYAVLENETINLPEGYEYTAERLEVNGILNNEGIITIN